MQAGSFQDWCQHAKAVIGIPIAWVIWWLLNRFNKKGGGNAT